MSAELVEARFGLSTAVPQRFFDAQAPQIARACRAMARRFARGGRLLVFGTGPAATDAQHVAVEFVHPVIVGKRPLPAIALTNDTAVLSTLAAAAVQDPIRTLVAAMGRADDILMSIESVARGEGVARALALARTRGMLTIALAGEAAATGATEPDFAFVVPALDPFAVQETQETLYHLLWELVHVFLETGAVHD